MVETPEEADIILYLPESAAWEKSECKNPDYASKLVVLDEGDGSNVMSFQYPWRMLYFKRSYVQRDRGVSNNKIQSFFYC
jgi:hypothetical protein